MSITLRDYLRGCVLVMLIALLCLGFGTVLSWITGSTSPDAIILEGVLLIVGLGVCYLIPILVNQLWSDYWYYNCPDEDNKE